MAPFLLVQAFDEISEIMVKGSKHPSNWLMSTPYRMVILGVGYDCFFVAAAQARPAVYTSVGDALPPSFAILFGQSGGL